MPNTTNWNIYYPDISTKPEMNTVIAGTASSVETALDNVVADRQLHSFIVANTTALNALSGMVAGDIAYQQDTGATYQYSGSAWSLWNLPRKTWTPTINNLTLGSATVDGHYSVTNGVLNARLKYTGASGASASGTVTVVPPVTLLTGTDEPAGWAQYRTASPSELLATPCWVNNSGDIGLGFYSQPGTYSGAQMGRISALSNSSQPSSWTFAGTGNTLALNITAMVA